MAKFSDEFTRIKKVLKDNPKGFTITQIADMLNISRQSASKYLSILNAIGLAEMRMFGPAKVYYPSERVPLYALLNRSSDAIMLLNKKFMIFDINDEFLQLFCTSYYEIVKMIYS